MGAKIWDFESPLIPWNYSLVMLILLVSRKYPHGPEEAVLSAIYWDG
jgi:hypothetical protein